MTEKQLKKINKLGNDVRNLEKASKMSLQGVFYYSQLPVKEYISLDDITLSKIKMIIVDRLNELKKEFEEL